MHAATEIRRLLLITGLVLLALGMVDLVAGADTAADPRLDSNARFAGAITATFGALWVLASRANPLPHRHVRILAAGLLLAGLSRTLTLLVRGYPGSFALAQTIVEIVVPTVILLLLTRVRA